MLPTTATPRQGEALAGYLWRVSRSTRIPMREVVAQVVPDVAARTTALGLRAVAPAAVPAMIKEVPVSPTQVREMTLTRFPAFRALPHLAEAPTKGRALSAQRAHWWHFDTDHYCPMCLARDGTWKVDWLHPWSFTCVEHEVVLRHTCTSCGRSVRLVTDAGRGATDEACQCGMPWARGSALAADVEDVALQVHLARVVGAECGALWGSSSSAGTLLEAWRATAALLAGELDVPRWALRPWLTPPPPPTARRVLKHAAAVVTAVDEHAAADALRVTFDDDDTTLSHRVQDRLPVATALTPIVAGWQRTRRRVATRLSHTTTAVVSGSELALGGLPTLAPLEVLDETWRRPGTPNMLLRRAVVSLAAARLLGAATWARAGECVGITPAFASRASRHVARAMGPGSAEELTAAALRLVASRHTGNQAVSGPPVDSFPSLRAFAAVVEPPAASDPYPYVGGARWAHDRPFSGPDTSRPVVVRRDRLTPGARA